MTFPMRRRTGCPVCGDPHAACGPSVASSAEAKAVDNPMLVRSVKGMAEEQDAPRELKRYRVQLDGNRGETIMKLTEQDAEAMGDRVLGEHDSEQKQHGMPQDQTKFADQTAAPTDQSPEGGSEEEDEQAKARTTSNKSKSARNK